MSDFTEIQKRLGRSHARVATIQEATNALNHFEKYYGREKCRDIKEIPTVISIPAFYYENFSPRIAGIVGKELLFQYNVTIGSNFYITGFQFDTTLVRNGVFYIKYTLGTTVFRYRLPIGGTDSSTALDTLYDREVILPNFCIEFWINTQRTIPVSWIGNKGILKIITSALSIPSYPEQTEVTINAPAAIGLLDLAIPFPMANPSDNSNMAFIAN